MARAQCHWLPVACQALFVVGPAVAAVAACRIDFSFKLVTRHVIASVNKIAVRAVPEFCRRFYCAIICMAVGAERLLVTDGAGCLQRHLDFSETYKSGTHDDLLFWRPQEIPAGGYTV